MSIKTLLTQLADQGVRISFSAGKLSVKAENRCMTPSIMAQLKQNKPDLLKFFQSMEKIKKSTQVAIEKVATAEHYPVSPAQRRLWLAEQVYGSSSTYHMPLVARLSGQVNVIRLEQAINAVLCKHDILRTYFKAFDDEIRQIVDAKKDYKLDFKQVDFQGTLLKEKVQEWVDTPFDLQRNWPIRFALWQLEANEYVLLGCVHHIACDGWSLGILQQDLALAYNNEHLLTELPIQYKDYAVWITSHSDNKAAESFWLQYLKDIPQVHQLPAHNLEQGRINAVGAKKIVTIDSALSTQISICCKELAITPFVLYRSVFALLVSRFSRQNEVVLGSPEAGRNASSLESLIGFFINTLVFRHQFNQGDISVRDWLISEQQSTLNVFEFKQYPFDQLTSLLSLNSEHRHNPVFQLMFSLQNTRSQQVEFNGFELRNFEGEHAVAKFDITLDVVQGKRNDFSHWEYNQSIFSSELIETMAQTYHQLLEKVCINLNGRLEDLSTGEQTPFTAVPLPAYADTFLDQIFTQPSDNIALFDEEKQITYGELKSKVTALVAQLPSASSQQSIAIWQERGVDYVVALLAIITAGHVAIPLEKSLSSTRLNHILDDARVTTVFGQPIDNRPDIEVILTDNDLTGDTADIQLVARQGAYVIYTSGSTGKPKGVFVCLKALNDHLRGVALRFDSLAGEHILHFTNFSVDTAFEQLFSGLSQGAKIYIKPSELWDSSQFWLFVNREKITCMDLPPSYLLTLISDPNSRAEFSKSTIRNLVLGGESFPEAVIHFWDQDKLWQRINLWNAYGPTEAVITATLIKITEQSLMPLPLGSLLAGRQALIVDQCGQPLPINIPGELWLGGTCLATEYLHNPEQTKSKFVSTPMGRFYRTGDNASMDREGLLHFYGREDHQVKIRGYRVELEEIEHVIAATEGINSAVVLVKQSEQADAYLVAFYSGLTFESKELRQKLADKLPNHMLPGHFSHLTQWPLLDNGKINRHAVAELKYDFQSPVSDLTLPVGRQQEVLFACWKKILKLDEMGIYESFFTLGGDSILAIRVVNALANDGWKLTVKDIFVGQTIEQIALKIHATEEQVSYSSVHGEVDLLSIQASFIKEQNDNWLHFNQAVALKLNQSINKGSLAQLLSLLSEQHDILRMTVRKNEQGISTYFGRHEDLGYNCVFEYDIDDFASEHWLSIINKHQAGFSLQSELLWQVLLVNHDNTQYLIWICHHFIVDSVSWHVMLSDFSALLLAEKKQEVWKFPMKTAPISVWQRDLTHWAGSLPNSTLRYWQKQLNTFRQYQLKEVKQVKVKVTVKETKIFSSSIAANQINKYLMLGREKLSMTEQELLLFLFSKVFSGVMGQQFVPITMENQGRITNDHLPDVSRTLGWFTALYPFVFEVSEDSLQDLICLKDSFRAIPDQGVSFSVLQHLNHGFDEFDTFNSICFNYLGKQSGVQEQDELPFEPAGIPLGDNQSPNLYRSFAIAINCSLTNDELNYSIDFVKSIVSVEQINSLADNLDKTLDQLISILDKNTKQATSSDFPLVTIDQETLTHIQEKYGEVAAIYPATPMQKGMVYHALMDELDVYIPQSHIQFKGPFDLELFTQAWQYVISRYEVLRSSFYLGPEQIMHVIFPNVDLPIKLYQGNDNEFDIETLKSDIRKQGFNVNSAPLMRLDIVQDQLTTDVIWTHHHSIIDGWSVPVIFNDLMACYFSLSKGQALPSFPPCQYRHYVNWLHQQNTAQALDFWRSKLSNADNKNTLGFHEFRHEQAVSYCSSTFKLEVDLTEKLVQFAKHSQVTVSTLLQGTWAWMLSKYSGDSTVCYGATVSGRPANVPHSSEMVGLFINSLPIVTELKTSLPVDQWLQSLQLTIAESEENGYVPLSDIAATVGKQGSELFDSLFIFENYPKEEAAAAGSELETQLTITKKATEEWTTYPLTIMVSDGAVILIRLVLDNRYQEVSWLQKLAQQWQQLLTLLVKNEWQDIAQWQLPLPEALPKLEALTVAKTLSFNLNDQLSDKLSDQLNSGGEKVAIYCSEEVYSYNDIAQQVTIISNYLSEHKVNKVGLHLTRTPMLLTAILASLISGTTFVPLDPAFPAERLSMFADEAQISLVLSDITGSSDLFHCNTQMIADLPKCKGLPQARGNNAYIMFTSGSTGKPKGVEISINALGHFLTSSQEYLNLAEQCHMLATTTYAFDISLLEMLLPILQGGTLTIANDEQHKNPDEVKALLANYPDINLMQGTPSFWRMMFASNWAGPTKIQTLLCGGEALSQELATQLCMNGATVINCYGPTEATVWSMMSQVSDTGPIRLNGSLAGYAHWVLDRNDNVLTDNMVGELCISSQALAQGYWQNAKLTAEKFFYHPSLNIQLYRTGDLVRLVDKDCFEFLGRIDEQVKLRGFRIELGEIDGTLRSMEQVSDACSLVKNVNGEQQLVSYVMGSVDINPQALLSELSKYLPYYMVPQYIEVLSELPKNNNGKVDKNRLPEISLAPIEHQVIPPQNTEQQQLHSIWSRVLKRSDFGVTDLFYNLGGNSLNLISMLAVLRKERAEEVSLSQLSGHLTIELLEQRFKSDSYSSDLFEPLITNECSETLYLLPPLSGYWENPTIFEQVETQRLNVSGIQLGTLLLKCSPQQIIQQVAKQIIDKETGDICLGAYSLGGLWLPALVNEMARQGTAVKSIVLIDCGHVSQMELKPDRPLITDFIARLEGKSGEALTALTQRLKECRDYQAVQLLHQSCNDDFEKEIVERLLVMLRHNHMIDLEIETLRSNVPAIYIAAETTQFNDDHVQAWFEYIGSLKRINVSGDHQSILQKPNNQLLFKQLEKELNYD